MTNLIEAIGEIEAGSRKLDVSESAMRANTRSILYIFGSNQKCAICDSYKESVAHQQKQHTFKPQIEINLNYQSPNLFYYNDHSYTFEYTGASIRLLEYEACAVHQSHIDDGEAGEPESHIPSQVDRDLLAYILNKNLLVRFILELRDEISNEAEYFAKVNAIARALADAVK